MISARAKKIFKWSGLLLGVFIAADFAVVLAFSLMEPKVKQADAVVVMGAGVYSPALYFRTLKALEFYENGQAGVIALTGGKVKDQDISEATYSQRVLQKNTSKPLNLVMDETSKNSFENLQHARELLKDAESIILVTDSFHLARSYFTAKAVGFESVSFASPENRYSFGELAYHYFREMVAMVPYLPVFFGSSR